MGNSTAIPLVAPSPTTMSSLQVVYITFVVRVVGRSSSLPFNACDSADDGHGISWQLATFTDLCGCVRDQILPSFDVVRSSRTSNSSNSTALPLSMPSDPNGSTNGGSPPRRRMMSPSPMPNPGRCVSERVAPQLRRIERAQRAPPAAGQGHDPGMVGSYGVILAVSCASCVVCVLILWLVQSVSWLVHIPTWLVLVGSRVDVVGSESHVVGSAGSG